MRAVLTLLSCIACVGYARRLFTTEHQPQSKALGRLLMMLDPQAAWTGGGRLASGISRRVAAPRLQNSEEKTVDTVDMGKSSFPASVYIEEYNRKARAKIEAIEKAEREKERGMSDEAYELSLRLEEKLKKQKARSAEEMGGTPAGPNVYGLPTDRYSDRLRRATAESEDAVDMEPPRDFYDVYKNRYGQMPGLGWLANSGAPAGVQAGGSPGFSLLNIFAGALFLLSALTFSLDQKGYFDNIEALNGPLNPSQLTSTLSNLNNQ